MRDLRRSITLSLTHNLKYQRSLFLFYDKDSLNNVIKQLLQYCFDSGITDIHGLIVSANKHSKSGKVEKEIDQILLSFPNINIISWSNVTPILGQTLDFLYIDLSEEFNPNKIILLIEAVRGGGIIFIRGNSYPKWLFSINKSQFTDQTSRKSILLEWFLSNIKTNPQCETHSFSISNIISRFNPMPFNINLSADFNGLPVSIEQSEVVTNLIKDFNNPALIDSCTILVANRGRGKSASIGLALSQIMFEKKSYPFQVIISSPFITNVQILFQFLLKGLNAKNITYRLKTSADSILSVITSTKSKIQYLSLNEIDEKTRCNLIVVDEAAAIPVEKIKEILKIKGKKIFVSTIHGYEGGGRGFQYKVINPLKQQKKIKYKIYSLSQPIRYLMTDEIENLVNNTFLLNIEDQTSYNEPEKPDIGSIVMKEYSNSEYLFSNKGISELRNLYAILIFAHYRNQPNDLLLLADSGKHFLVGLWGNKKENHSKLLSSTQLVKEGEMKNEEISDVKSGQFISGNLIPTIAIRHFSDEFAKLRGLRIIRFAVHPSLIDKGFGRLTLELQLEKYSSYDWIGVSFGATKRLVKFWNKFQFKAVHIRPIKTPETGEWNLIVIRPNSNSANHIVNQASSDFMFQFLALLKQSLHSMDPELVVQILRMCVSRSHYKLKLTPSAKIRLQNYLMGTLNFLLAVDGMYELLLAYFTELSPIGLSSTQEKLLIARILQGRTWGQTLGKTGLSLKAANGLLKKAINKLAKHYLNI